jgi:ActR/RegA family two-component response regulator
MYVVDTFQDDLFISRGCADMFMTDPAGSHAVVVSSENTVFVALSTLGTDPRWDFAPSQSEVVDLGVEQAAVVQFIEIPRSARSTVLMPVLAGGAELASAVASIEPQGVNSIAMPSTADIA